MWSTKFITYTVGIVVILTMNEELEVSFANYLPSDLFLSVSLFIYPRRKYSGTEDGEYNK
jgi:hypothetical protein